MSGPGGQAAAMLAKHGNALGIAQAFAAGTMRSSGATAHARQPVGQSARALPQDRARKIPSCRRARRFS
jgi:hypothetical protein